MTQKRRFDWDEAKRLRKRGLTYQAIADQLGVSSSGVERVLKPRLRAKMALRIAEAQASGICKSCGKRCSLNRTRSKTYPVRCRACFTESRVTSVRDDALQCLTCREWKWDPEFPWSRSSSGHRRGRHESCRSCQTILKREYRERTKAPCSSCGTLVLTADRRDKEKPLECRPCATKRIHLAKRPDLSPTPSAE